MKKSVNQWCFPDGTGLDQLLRVASDAGLDGLELNIYEPGGIGLTLDTTEREAQEVLRKAKSYGIELPSLSNGLLWRWPLSSPEKEIRIKGSQIVRKQLEIASMLGMGAILVVPGLVDTRTTYEECWKRSQDEIADLATYAHTLGVEIGIENVWNKFLLSPTDMLRYIEEIGSSSVGAYFDVGNVLNFGFPQQWIETLGTHIIKVHVKDFSLKVGNIHGFVPLLAGDVDWKAVRDSLRKVGYDDYLTAEIAPYASDPNRAVYDASEGMNTIIAMR